MRGRKPPGPEFVDRLEGSVQAKRRLTAILQTLAQDKRVIEASAELDLTPQRFHMLRQQALQAALQALEPGQPGRPRHRPTPQQEHLQDLQRDNEQLRHDLVAALVREEIALVLPGRKDRGEKKSGAAAVPCRRAGS
jgi:hypothetical protein